MVTKPPRLLALTSIQGKEHFFRSAIPDKTMGIVFTSTNTVLRFQKSQTLCIGKCICFLSVSTSRALLLLRHCPFCLAWCRVHRELRFIKDLECAKIHTRCFMCITPLNPLMTLEVATVFRFPKKKKASKFHPSFKKWLRSCKW